MSEFKFGDACRAECTAPARYFGFGKCLFISAQDNDFCVDDATPAKGNEEEFPLPTDEFLSAANVAYGAARFDSVGYQEKLTRAVLIAVREPTKEMIDAGVEALGREEREAIGVAEKKVTRIFDAMIDEALK